MPEKVIDPVILEEARKWKSWITYKGKEILYDDYRNLSGEKFSALVDVQVSLTLESGKKNILSLVDVRNSYAIKETVDVFNNAGKVTKGIAIKTAVLGITGVKKIFLNVINKITNIGAKPFNTIEEAKDWLVEED